jgi:hypothetical protein
MLNGGWTKVGRNGRMIERQNDMMAGGTEV